MTARDWIKIPPTPERLAEIRTFADSDVLDLVEPEEMYYFLDLEEQLEAQRELLANGAEIAAHFMDTDGRGDLDGWIAAVQDALGGNR